MKKILSLILICILVAAHANVPVLAERNINVTLNGEKIYFDQPPIIQNGRTLVPMRVIFEAMGCDVVWHGDLQQIVVWKDNELLMNLQIGRKTMDLFDLGIEELDVPPQVINNRTLVPVRAISESMGAKVDWNSSTYTVIIEYDSEGYDNESQENYEWLDAIGYMDYGTTRSASDVYSVSNVTYRKNGDKIIINRGVNFLVTNPDYSLKKETSDNDDTWVTYSLDGRYKKLITDIITTENYYSAAIKPTTLKIYGDDRLLYTSPKITEDSETISVELDISGVSVLKIETVTQLQKTSSICGSDRKRNVILHEAKLFK